MSTVCIVVDNLNFNGGAHLATAALVRALVARGVVVDLLTMQTPSFTAKERFPVREICVCPYPSSGFAKFFRGVLNHLKFYSYPDWTLDPQGRFRAWIARHDVVCCIGEQSIFRQMISSLPPTIRKVMMIHNDYATWAKLNAECRRITRWDRKWYARYDAIGVVGTVNAARMAATIPGLAGKLFAFHNVLSADVPRRRDGACGDKIRLITLSRIEGAQKNSERYLRVASALKARGVDFDWSVYGDGPELNRLRELARRMRIDDVFHLRGFDENAKRHVAESDLLVLLSTFEGLPNTIYESLMAGVPVFSTNVGAVSEQVDDGRTGWLVEDDEETVVGRLSDVLGCRDGLEKAISTLRDYHYDNCLALREHLVLFGFVNSVEEGERVCNERVS